VAAWANGRRPRTAGGKRLDSAAEYVSGPIIPIVELTLVQSTNVNFFRSDQIQRFDLD
jgi:hypothetical protein